MSVTAIETPDREPFKVPDRCELSVALWFDHGTPAELASSLASYLMFESGYTRELIALGFADAMARRDELCDLLFGAPATDKPAPQPVRELLADDRIKAS